MNADTHAQRNRALAEALGFRVEWVDTGEHLYAMCIAPDGLMVVGVEKLPSNSDQQTVDEAWKEAPDFLASADACLAVLPPLYSYSIYAFRAAEEYLLRYNAFIMPYPRLTPEGDVPSDDDDSPYDFHGEGKTRSEALCEATLAWALNRKARQERERVHDTAETGGREGKGMSDTVRGLHDQAMDHAMDAYVERHNQNADAVKYHLGEAYKLERQAAELVAFDAEHALTRAILYRSAASLATDAGLFVEAIELALEGRKGCRYASIDRELVEVCEQARQRLTEMLDKAHAPLGAEEGGK